MNDSRRTLLFVTDLDGTLLDEHSYSFAPAEPALAALRRGRETLVLASSKTRAEMVPLAQALGLVSPLIVENGGALLLPRVGGGYESVALGSERALLVRALAGIAVEVGGDPKGFSALTVDEVVRFTGLDAASAARAMDREFDEPFLLRDADFAGKIAEAAARRGMRVTRGGRFFHLTGDSDKGRALLRLLPLLDSGGELPFTIGLGDAANDVPLLQAVDRPIVIPGRGGRIDPEIAAALPGAERAPEPGPAGWNAAVLSVLEGRRLPTVEWKGGG